MTTKTKTYAGTESERMENLQPYRLFSSVKQAVGYIKAQVNPLEALKAIVSANLQMGEFGFASELIFEAEVILQEVKS